VDRWGHSEEPQNKPQEVQKPLLIDDLLIEWLEIDVKGSVSESTYLSYQESCRLHISPELGTNELPQVLPKTIKSWYNNLREKKADYTARSALACLRGALNWAVANGYFLVNPALGIRVGTPKPKRPAIRLKVGEARALMAAPDDDTYATMVQVGFQTGDRLGEILAWKWDAIDWQEGTIEIRQQLQVLKNKKGRVTNDPKSKRSKAKAPLPPRLLARLSKLREQQLEAQALRGTPDPDDGLVFLSQAGTRFWPRNVERVFARLLEKALW
jgi:integrase